MNATLITVLQLADRTGLPVAWLKREADAKRLPCLRVGRRRMFDLHEVQHVFARRRAGEVNRGR